MKLKATLPVVALVALAFALAACGNVGGSGEKGGGGPTITVGSKNFTEQFILGELYAQTLEANGFTVERQLNLGSEQIADRALQDGQIDFYPEYTGTALVAIFGDEIEDLPKTPEATYEEARTRYAERDPADTMLTPADFNNNYGIFVRREVAEEQNLRTLQDLAEASSGLTFATFSEFQDREDGYPNMLENYPDFDFEEIVTVNDLGLRYQGVEQGEADVGVGFLTDGQLTSDELVIMEDEKSIWPFYYPAPVVRSDVLEENPQVEEILNSVTQTLDVETIRELNGQVDIEQEDPEDVAEDFLREQGLI